MAVTCPLPLGVYKPLCVLAFKVSPEEFQPLRVSQIAIATCMFNSQGFQAELAMWLFMYPLYKLYINCHRKKKKKKSCCTNTNNRATDHVYLFKGTVHTLILHYV